MGTTFTVKVVVDDSPPTPAVEEQVRQAVTATLERVDGLMSTWREDSEISRFNRHREATPFLLDPESFEVLRLAQEVSRASGGAFDVTVGPLVDAWGFGSAPAPELPPPDDVVEALREATGFELLVLDAEERTATKLRPGLRVDLSAIAKGWAIDRVADDLAALGRSRFMVEVGGEIRVAGTGPEGGSWRLAVEQPAPGRRAIQRIVELSAGALATSGDYRNFRELDGVRYSHTIDPRSGRPVRHALASASVIHRRCTLADAWATALMVLGPGDGLRLAQERNLAVLLLVYDEGGVRELVSPAMRPFLAG